jgi:archaemetzincin
MVSLSSGAAGTEERMALKFDVLLTATEGFPSADAKSAQEILDFRLNQSFVFTVNGKSVSPPLEGYNEERKQYSAEAFLPVAERLQTEMRSYVSIVLTDVDVFAKFTNYVFGLADMVHRVAVVSSHRIHPSFWGMNETREIFEEQWGKVVTHEFGHTLGMLHCENWDCVMKYSNSPTELHRKGKDFCSKCARELEQITENMKR